MHIYSTINVNTLMWYKWSWVKAHKALHPAADHKHLDPVTFSGNTCPVSNTSAAPVMKEKNGLLKLNFCLSTQICCNHTGTAQITTAELQRDIIMQMQDKAQSLGHLFNYCFISNQNLEQALQPGVLHLHVVSALKGQSRAYKESGHNRLAAKLKLKPT